MQKAPGLDTCCEEYGGVRAAAAAQSREGQRQALCGGSPKLAEKAQELGLLVGILGPPQFHSRQLRQYTTFLKRIRQGDLAASQLPKTLTVRKGTFAKPSGW